MKNTKTSAAKQLQNSARSFRLSVAALFLALLCGAVIIGFCGFSPLETYRAIFAGSLGNQKGIVLSLSQATPLMFTGLAFAIAYRVKIVNLGEEGQLYAGAMASALAGCYLSGLPAVLHITLALLAGIAAGGIVGLFTGFLKVRFGAQEVITSIMVNEIVILFTSYLCNGPVKAEGSVTPQTERILETAKLPRLVPRSQLTIAILIVIVIAVLLQLLLKKTALGYEMRVTGFNLKAAKTAGINVNRVYLFTFFISSAIAGLCGSILVLGVNGRFVEDLSANYGFGGISVAALAAYNPVVSIFSAVIFGILKAGAMTVNRTTAVPIEFVSVIQALVVVFVAAPKLISRLTAAGSLFRTKRNSAEPERRNLS